MTEPLGPIIITAREVYDAVVRLSTQISDLKGDIREIKDKVDNQTDEIKEHESRIRALEKRLWPLQSVSILIAIAAVAATILYH